MLQLVEEGRLSLDDPIGNWLFGYPQIDPSITIRQLLNNTSGIDPWEENPASPVKAPGVVGGAGALDVVDWDKEWTLDEMLTTLAGEPNFTPGEGWRYFTTGLNLAREVIEQETGMPMSQALRTRLLDPLGLDGIWVEFDQPIPEDVEFAHPWTFDLDGDGKPDDFCDKPRTWIYTLSPTSWRWSTTTPEASSTPGCLFSALWIAASPPGSNPTPEGSRRQLVAGKGFLFSDRGDVALRGFEDSVRLYEVRWREG